MTARLNGTPRKVLGRSSPLLTAAHHGGKWCTMKQFPASSNASRHAILGAANSFSAPHFFTTALNAL
jgi:hypothetical protein